MSYIGNEPTTAHFPMDTFSGDGSTVAFVLSQTAGSASAIDVHVGGIFQTPSSGYTLSGGTITFTSAPPSGTNNIVVIHKGVQVQVPTPADGSVTAAKMESGEIPFATSFTSAEQTITSAGSLAIAHGLSASPSLIQYRLVCKTAEHNYSVDDEITVSFDIHSSSTVTRVNSLVLDATNINIRFSSDAICFISNDKTTGAAVSLTNANWKLIVRAWV